MEPGALVRGVALCRVLFGVAVAHRYLAMAGYAPISPHPVSLAARAYVGVALGGSVAVGFLTPCALVGLLLLTLLAPIAHSLGMLVARITIWGLLFLGGGTAWSCDSWLLRRRRPSIWIGPLYMLAPRTAQEVGEGRLVTLALYWTLATTALLAHVGDTFWRAGAVLPLLFGSPFFTDFSMAFAQFREAWPRACLLLCRLGLGVQAFWELAFLPLLFLRLRVARLFAIAQGATFFLVSLLFMNLGYLPVFELCLWVLAFAYKGTGEADGALSTREHTPRLPRRIPLGLATVAIGVCLSAALLDTLRESGIRGALERTGVSTWLMGPFGLQFVNVFNRNDLSTNATYVVLLATDADGRPERTVPVLGMDGGRLDWLRNDYLFYDWVLPFTRSLNRHAEKERAHPSLHTAELLRTMANLDVCLSATSQEARRYKGFVVTRSAVEQDGMLGWSPPESTVAMDIFIDRKAAASIQGTRASLGCFHLPPGHWRSGEREVRTVEWARLQDTPANEPPSHSLP